MGQLEATIQSLISASYLNDSDLTTVLETVVRPYTVKLYEGTGVGQANALWTDRRTLAAGITDSLDLAGGLTDAFGDTLNFTTIRAVLLYNTETSAGRTLTIGNAAVNPCALWFSAAVQSETLHREGISLHVSPTDGWTVGAGASDVLRITNPTAFSITYDIYVIGIV